MAYATGLTIGTGNKVTIAYQSQEVNVSLTYQLEREDVDVLQVVHERAAEVAQAHRTAWQRIRDARVSGTTVEHVKTVENVEAAAVQTSPHTPPRNSPSSETNPTPEEPSGVSSPEDEVLTEDEASTQATSIQDEVATAGQQAALQAILSHLEWSEEQVRDYLITHFSGASIECNSIEQLTQRQASQWLLELQRREREKAQQRRQSAVPLNGKPAPA